METRRTLTRRDHRIESFNHRKSIMKATPILTASLLGASLCLSAQAADDTVYAKLVKPILDSSCVKCHGPEKVKGKLKLDTPEGIQKGGGEGVVIVAGKSAESTLFKRVNLPKDDDEHMPPEGDPLTKEQIEALKWWIDNHQASFEVKFDPASAPDVIKKLAENAPKVAQNAAPKKEEEKLPEVPAADAALMKPLQDLGVLVMPLAQNTNLLHVETVSVAKNITDQQVAMLEPLAPQVAWLYLNKTGITDEALKTVGKLKQLKRLHLANTKITDTGLGYLTGLTELETLNVYGTQVTDAALDIVAKLPKLKNVYFYDTKVNPRTAFRFVNKNPKLGVNLGWDFEQLKTLDVGLALHEVFNDKVAGEAKDGALTYADGPSAKAANFDGKAYVVAGDLANFEKTESFSVAAWVKPAEQDLNVIAARSDSDDADRGWKFQIEKGRLGLGLISAADNAIRVEAKQALEKDKWYYVAASYDGSGKGEGVKLYIDGQAAEAEIKMNSLNRTIKTFQVLHLGRAKSGPVFKGQMDELRIYPKALSADQVGALFDRYDYKKPVQQAAAGGLGKLSFVALGAAGLFDDNSCCAKALAATSECEHECCKKALAESKVCLKCNPGAKDKPLPKL